MILSALVIGMAVGLCWIALTCAMLVLAALEDRKSLKWAMLSLVAIMTAMPLVVVALGIA